MTLDIRTYHQVGDTSDLGDQVARQQSRVDARLKTVRHVVGVMSGKGGVGKSLVTAGLATAFARRGHAVGVLDADLNGPSIGRMLGCPRDPLGEREDGIDPARAPCGALVMSMDLLLERDVALQWHEPAEASFVWRGTQERGAVREFLADVRWGRLDVLLVDLPPGIGRLAELHELVPDLTGVIAVTIPSAASGDAVARSLDLAGRRGIRVLGLVENLGRYRCQACGGDGPLFGGDASRALSERFDVAVLGAIPFDPALDRVAANGALDAWIAEKSATARDLESIAHRLETALLRDPDAREGAVE